MYRIFTIIAAFAICTFGFAQDDKTYEGNSRSDEPTKERKFDWNRVNVGGNFGGNLNSNQLQVQISPIISYRISERLRAGAGPIFEHYRIFGSNRQKPFDRSSIWGAQTITRFDVIQGLFAEVDFQWINYEDFQNPKEDANGLIIGYNRKSAFALPIGGGYQQPIGNNARLTASVLYDVLWSREAFEDGRTPYGTPIRFQFGVSTSLGNFGF